MDVSGVVQQIIISAFPILIAIVFHELSHGFVAYKLGDPTAKMMGRLTLNPIAHIDPIGTIVMPIMLLVLTNGQFMFGYAKPVPINPMNFKNPKKDMAISAAAGPVSNILLAIFSALVLHFILTPFLRIAPTSISKTIIIPLLLIFTSSAFFNIILACFNMIPIPPLDGGRVLTGLLPYKMAISFSKIEPFGFMIVLILIFTNMTSYIVTPFISFFVDLLQLHYYLGLLH